MTMVRMPVAAGPKRSPAAAVGAFSLLELVATLAILGLIVAAGIGTFGSNTVQNVAAEGFARKLALDLMQARRRTIATGDNHYLQCTVVAGKVTSYAIYRRAAGGDVVVDQTQTVPAGATVTTSHTTLEFDFDGAALAAYSLTVAGPSRSWTVSTTVVTGAVRIL
jgi:type II secretory pathway pseudopilin PulG